MNSYSINIKEKQLSILGKNKLKLKLLLEKWYSTFNVSDPFSEKKKDEITVELFKYDSLAELKRKIIKSERKFVKALYDLNNNELYYFDADVFHDDAANNVDAFNKNFYYYCLLFVDRKTNKIIFSKKYSPVLNSTKMKELTEKVRELFNNNVIFWFEQGGEYDER